MLNFE